jgi:hypothetical protein
MKSPLITINKRSKAQCFPKLLTSGFVGSTRIVKEDKPGFYASYSMQTEALNYARFLIGMMNEEVLNKERHDDMLKVQYPEAGKSPSEQWGLGIGIRRSEFGDEFFHNGFNLNFTSDFMFNKDQRFGYVFFTNCNKGSDFNKKLLEFFKGNDE